MVSGLETGRGIVLLSSAVVCQECLVGNCEADSRSGKGLQGRLADPECMVTAGCLSRQGDKEDPKQTGLGSAFPL